MKGVVIVLLLLSFSIPCLAGRFEEAAKQAAEETNEYHAIEIDELINPKIYTKSDMELIIKGHETLNKMRASTEEMKRKIAKENNFNNGMFCAGLGIWGIVNFGATGGAYPLIIGSLFLYNAYVNLYKVVIE